MAMVLCITCVAAANANQVLLRYADIGDSGSTHAVAADKACNLFVVSNVTDEAGFTLVHVNKLTHRGMRLPLLTSVAHRSRQPPRRPTPRAI